MSQTVIQVDSFTNRPFAGNPAAVCVMSGPADEGWMRNIAQEMNLSETAFLYPEAERYNLRWFTPVVEVELCGHATLASAHVLWEEGHLHPKETARFMTRSGELTATRDDEWIELNFPATPAAGIVPPESLTEALGAPPVFVGKNEYDYLIELDSDQAVRALKPDFGKIQSLPVRAVMVTAESSDNRFDFISRFFAPAAGIDEDPVTGSAHCALGPYWQTRLGKNKFLAYQASSRGDVVRVTVDNDRIRLGGLAVTVMRGQFTT